MSRRPIPIEPVLPLLALSLVALGLAMIYSASAPRSLSTYGNTWHFAARQGIWVSLGAVTLAIGTWVDYRTWQRLLAPLLLGTIVLLIFTLLPGVGISAGGARRWLGVSAFRLQPSELAKFVCVVYMASYVARHRLQLETGGIGPVLRPLMVVGTVLMLIVVEPDLGNAVAIACTTGALLFMGGMRWRYILPLILSAAAALAGAVFMEPYRLTRIASYLNPWADPTGSGFQMVQSFLAFGSGGVTGMGLGEGRQKLFFLPEPHTDFIFSVIGEELGLMGALGVVVLFALFAWRGFLIARSCSDPFGRYLAMGLTLMVVMQALINMGVTVGALPNKGLPLPFVSYGGSSLLLNLFAVGVLINLSKVRHGRSGGW